MQPMMAQRTIRGGHGLLPCVGVGVTWQFFRQALEWPLGFLPPFSFLPCPPVLPKVVKPFAPVVALHHSLPPKGGATPC